MGIERVTTPLLLVADLITGDSAAEHYAYGVAKATGLQAGTVQPILSRFEKAGWLKPRWEDIDPHVEGRRPRRLYKLTGEGEKAMAGLLHDHAHRLRRFRTSPSAGGALA